MPLVPGQLMVKIVKDELTELMGGSETDLDSERKSCHDFNCRFAG